MIRHSKIRQNQSERFLTKEEAEENEANGVRCMEDAGRGYRVVVASPMPQRIRELETIKTLVNCRTHRDYMRWRWNSGNQ